MRVIDTSVLVAALLYESGHEVAQRAMEDGYMSYVNVAESIAVIMRKGFNYLDAVDMVENAGLLWCDISREGAFDAGRLSRTPQLSLGDSFCIALAKSLNAPVVTADRVWADLNLGVDVELIR